MDFNTTAVNLVNSTNATTIKYVADEKMWLANLVVTLAGIVLGAYVTLALSVYHYIKRRDSTKSEKNTRGSRLGMHARILCTVVAFMVTLYSCLKLVNLIVQRNTYDGNNGTWNCSFLWQITNASLFLASFFSYVFLWTRQRVFYVHKVLAQLNSRGIQIFSFVVLILWIVYCVTATVIVFFVVHYQYTEYAGCLIVPGSGRKQQLLSISFVIVCAFMQVSLLILFIYPILRKSSITPPMKKRSQRGLPKENRENRSLDRVLGRVKKAIIIAVICIVTDIITPIMAIFLHSPVRSSFTSAYVINLSINMISIILCFDNWNVMLFPWMPSKKPSAFRSSTTGNTSHVSNVETASTPSSY